MATSDGVVGSFTGVQSRVLHVVPQSIMAGEKFLQFYEAIQLEDTLSIRMKTKVVVKTVVFLDPKYTKYTMSLSCWIPTKHSDSVSLCGQSLGSKICM